MTRMFALNALKAGISRLKTKGSADPQTLYDLVNGYVTPSGTVESRPGLTADAVLPAGETRGLMSYRGRKYVFADHFVDLGHLPEYRLVVLTHPGNTAEPGEEPTPPTLTAIHFAEPFLGYPYVVAEWSDGQIVHNWLQGEGLDVTVWQPDTVYRLLQIVHPSVPNGFTYEAHRLGEPGPPWAPDVERAVGDVIEPTTQNGFEYVAVETYGTPPRSGKVEPNWPTEPGAIVIEEADLSPAAPPPAAPPPAVPPSVRDRYGSGTGGDGGGGFFNQVQ